MKTKILKLIDFERLNSLLQGFNKSTGFVCAISNLDGTVLSKSDGRQICSNFHCLHPVTLNKCKLSDAELIKNISADQMPYFHNCLNGLVDIVVPVVVEGEHVANLFSGQLFLEKPELDFFKKQAKQHGFDEEEYFQALKNVPVITKDKALDAMNFLLDMTQLIFEMSFQKLEQIELNKTLKESEERFSKIFKSSPIAIFIAEVSTGKVTEVNDNWCQLLGFSKNEMLGHDLEELKIIDKENRKKLRSEFLRTGKIHLLETQIFTKSGDKKNILTSAELIIINDKEFSIILLLDITAQKQAQELLQLSESKFKSIFESANVGKSITLPSGKMNVNEAFCTLLGYTRTELQGKKWQEITPESEIPEVETKLDALIKGENDTARFEKRYLCKNGELIWTDVSVSVIRDEKGELLYFIATIIDISAY